FMWSPLSVTTIRRLPLPSAGAGSGVYNTTRQVGAVLGSAALAALINWRLSAVAPGLASDTATIPAEFAEAYTRALAESFLLPIAGLALAGIFALFFTGHPSRSRSTVG